MQIDPITVNGEPLATESFPLSSLSFIRVFSRAVWFIIFEIACLWLSEKFSAWIREQINKNEWKKLEWNDRNHKRLFSIGSVIEMLTFS